MDIYYMLGRLGWVQFSNGVSANTHRKFALEILMTMPPILDEGVLSLSFRLEGIQQVVPYERNSRRNVGWILEFNLWGSPPTKEFHPEPHHPSISLMDVEKEFGENEGDEGDQHGVELS
jgi:hypothetical protein